MAGAPARLLPGLVAALNVVHAQIPAIHIFDFTELIERASVIFDQLGSVLAFAKQDMVTKVEILRRAIPAAPTVAEILAVGSC